MRDVKDALKRVISLGGGVQSTAMCVLAVQGKLDEIMGGPIDAAVFSNLGEDSENPETLKYLEDHLIPWCESNGLRIDVVTRTINGQPVTLRSLVVSPDNRTIDIPIRNAAGKPGHRNCTVEFKIEVVHRWLRENGVDAKPRGKSHGMSKVTEEQVKHLKSLRESGLSFRAISTETGVPKSTVADIINGKTWAKENTFAAVAIGISTDEIHRVNNHKRILPIQENVYPLIELDIDREQCKKIIADAGLPVPPKSACYFCPFQGRKSWYEMKKRKPELFEKSVELELLINKKRKNLGRDDEVFLCHGGLNLERTVEHYANTLKDSGDVFNDGECDEGYCWT